MSGACVYVPYSISVHITKGHCVSKVVLWETEHNLVHKSNSLHSQHTSRKDKMDKTAGGIGGVVYAQ